MVRPCISASHGYDLVMTDGTFERCSSVEMLDSLLQTIETVHSRPSGRFVAREHAPGCGARIENFGDIQRFRILFVVSSLSTRRW